MSIFNCSQGVLPHHQAAALFLRTKENLPTKKLNSKSSDGRARRAISIINYQQLSLPAIEKINSTTNMISIMSTTTLC
jgi:hypothetical protein